MKCGILKLNKQGRYEIEKNIYFTSGEPIEILTNNKWIDGRIEYSHKHSDYYFINDSKGICIHGLIGLKARCS